MIVALLACTPGGSALKYSVVEGSSELEDSFVDSGGSANRDTDGPGNGADSSGDASASYPDPCFTYQDPVTVGTVVDTELDEISDIVPSSTGLDILWVHEDSGNDARIIALASSGNTLGTFSLQNDAGETYGMNDWEDMAMGACRYFPAKKCLYMGDIGDNALNRGAVRILEFPEPELEGLVEGVGVVTAAAYDVAYPDGIHNAEALLWGPLGPVVLTKQNTTDTTLYQLDLGSLSMELLGTLSTATDVSALTTAADLWPDGSRILVRTYSQVLEFWLSSGGMSDLEHVVRIDLPRPDENQGESASYDPIRRGIWTVSEGLNVSLHFMGCSSDP